MKKMKKIFALLIAMVMVLGMSTSVFAAALPEGTAGGDKTITITPPSGVAADAKNTYTVYKVFNFTFKYFLFFYRCYLANIFKKTVFR